MIYIQITGKTFETTRIVPNILRHIYGTEIQISGNIPQDKNCIIVCNHQSGKNELEKINLNNQSKRLKNP